MKGLILLKGPGTSILNGEKIVEIRSCRTHKRERIGIIICGTKKVWGTVEIYDCVELTKELYEGLWKDKHKSSKIYEEILQTYPKPYAWLLKDAKTFKEAISYKHKNGCITWLNIDNMTNNLKNNL